MKALLVSALVFFSLRAMSAEVGEYEKAPCPYGDQSNNREAKVVDNPNGSNEAPTSSSLSK